MKKVFVVLAVLLVCFTLASCGTSKKSEVDELTELAQDLAEEGWYDEIESEADSESIDVGPFSELPAEISSVVIMEDNCIFYYKDEYYMSSGKMDNYRNGHFTQSEIESDAAFMGFENADIMLSYFDSVLEYIYAHPEEFQG